MEFLGRQEVFPPKENVSNKEKRAWSKRAWSLTHLLSPHFSQAGPATVYHVPNMNLNDKIFKTILYLLLFTSCCILC